MQYFKQVFIDV